MAAILSRGGRWVNQLHQIITGTNGALSHITHKGIEPYAVLDKFP